MARQGYSSELKCKQENIELYGKLNVLKIAIGGSSDFLITYRGRLIKFIEVKETKKERYYPSPRERKQFKELVRLGKHHQIPVELWIYFKRGTGKATIKHVRRIYDTKKTQEAGEEAIRVHRREGKVILKSRKTNLPNSQMETNSER